MTAPTDTGAADLAELVRLVAWEAEEGRRGAAADAASRGGLAVAAVRVRLGREAVPPGADEPAGMLPPGRYPAARRGWEIEIDLRPAAGPRARVGDEDRGPVPPPPTLLDVFGDRPVGALKGAASAWTKRLGNGGITTIAQLAAVAMPDLEASVGPTRLRRALELRTKARLLDAAAPWLPRSPADAAAVWELAGRAPGELRKLVGVGRCSAREAERLAELLSRLVTALDAAVLRSVTLADVRTVPAPPRVSRAGPPPTGSSPPGGR